MSEEKYEVKIRPEKEAVVAEMKDRLSSQGVVLLTFNKLTVKDATLLRRKFLAHGVEYKVIKNTLTRIAADELGLEGLDDLLQGPNGIATCKDDGKVIDKDAVKALADLPSREQLLGMVASTLQAPIAGLARALNGNIQKLAYALEALRKQKESA